MFELSYDPLDVMTTLEVEAKLDEEASCEFYVVERDGLLLDVAISLAEPLVQITLKQPKVETRLVYLPFWCAQIRRLIDSRGERLEFEGCIIGNTDYYPGYVPTGPDTPFFSVRLWVKPHIRVEMV